MTKQAIIEKFREKFPQRESKLFPGEHYIDNTAKELEQFLSEALDQVEEETIEKTFDWIWDGWDLDLANKDRAKEHFTSKYTTSGETKE